MPNVLAANWQRFLMLLAGSMFVSACLYAAKAILVPIILALLLTFILNPVVAALQKLRLGRVFSVLIVAGGTFSVLAVLGWIFTQQLAEFARELPKHKDMIVQKVTNLQGAEEGLLGNLLTFVQDVGDEIGKEKTPRHANDHPELTNIVFKDSSPPMNFTWVTILLGPLVDSLIGGVFVVVLVILMLVHRENLRNRIIRLAGYGRLISTTKVLDDVAHRISSFLFMQAVVNITFGITLGVGLYLIGVPYVLFFAFLSGFLRFIPYVGTSVAGVLLLICNFAFFPDWTECLLTLGLFALLEMLTAYVAEPWLFGRNTGTSPLAILIAAAFWSWLWGPIGLILSTPMTVCLIVLGKYVPNLMFLNILLGDEPVLTEDLRYYQRLLARDQDEAIEVIEHYLESHPVEAIYDDILVPALVLAKRDVAVGELTEEQARWVRQNVRETFEEYIALQQAQNGAREHAPAAITAVLAYAAHDDGDDLALRMLQSLLQERGQEVSVFSSETLASEFLAAVEQGNPATVLIAGLPAGGLTHTYYLCKRLRARLPELNIIVGRWGLTEKVEQVRERALAEGANEMHTRILQTADAIRAAPAASELPQEMVSA